MVHQTFWYDLVTVGSADVASADRTADRWLRHVAGTPDSPMIYSSGLAKTREQLVHRLAATIYSGAPQTSKSLAKLSQTQFLQIGSTLEVSYQIGRAHV